MLFSSCAVPINLRDRAIVQVMGIDYVDNKYKVILQEYLPISSGKNSNQEENSSEYVSSEGETLFDAIKNAEAKDGNQAFYGQCRLYVIGKTVLKKGIGQITEFMNSNYQLSLSSSVVATEENADEILKAKLFSSVAPNISVSRIEGCGKAIDTTVIDILKMMYNFNGAGVLPLISLTDKDNAVIEKCVVLKNYKGYINLNNEQTMGLVWLENAISDAVMTTNQNGYKLSVGVVSQKTDIKLLEENDKLTLRVYVSAKGNVSESGVVSSKKINLTKIKKVETDIEQKIESQILAALKKIVTEGKTDILYLKQRLKKTDTELYNKLKDDDEWLEDINFDVSAKFSVRHSGIGVK